ncbi:MAG: lipoyl synthase, partial [Verrucomicrobiae bacterium]|nr:lipoyl synthase [Verrucomicrobiae bacterium]
RGTATFMVAGDRCTRACRFCAVTTAKPLPLDAGEPARVAEACARLKLKHVVITMVARDDLEDGAAAHVAEVVRSIRSLCPDTVQETLTTDFNGSIESLRVVLEAGAEVFNHNVETVERLTPSVRSRAQYHRSLEVLRRAKEIRPKVITKSGLMLGLGESEAELLAAFRDLRQAGCDVLTLGQYLQPTLAHLPVVEFISPERFSQLRQVALGLGFLEVFSGPLVRSSYHADELKLEGAA